MELHQIGRILIGIAILLGIVSSVRSVKYYKITKRLNNEPARFWKLKNRWEKVVDVLMLLSLAVGGLILFIL